MNKNVLLEVGVEEIPHEVLTDTIIQLKEKAIDKLNTEGLIFGKIFVYGTPRRLAIRIVDVERKTKNKKIEKKGPSVKAAFDENGKPTKALMGFLSNSHAKVEDINKKEVSGNEYVFLEINEGGKETVSILPELFKEVLLSLSFPKTMKWGSGSLNFVRPIRWIVSLYGEEKLAFDFNGIKAGNTSYGHRLLHKEPFIITSSDTYKTLLKERNVVVDQDERKEQILDLIHKTAKRMQAKPILSDSLLDTIINLTEYPEITVGTFEEEFLKLPKEVLISEMVEHQKYIPLEDNNGDLINRFIIITNTQPNNTIVKGNERVIRARFSDGKFFFDEDRKKKLEEYIPDLKNVLYAKGLGSVHDKAGRIQQITAVLSEIIGYNDALSFALRTAFLCKADLVSSMVYEFPELQGIIGYYYALNSGENINVAISIKEHYCPRYSGDSLPSLKEGILVSLADRFDNLFAMYAKGSYVTGSRDPFGLRRQTLGIIRILIEKKIHLNISKLLKKIIPLYEGFLSVPVVEFESRILEFITTRIKTVFKEYDFDYDEIESGITTDVSDIYDSYLRIDAIHIARKSENFINLAIAFKRVKNIIKGLKIKEFNESALTENAEKNLYKIFMENQKSFEDALEKMDYKLCISILTSFKPSVDKFFDDVLVMEKDENLKNNRTALLSLLDNLFMKFIDFEKIVVE